MRGFARNLRLWYVVLALGYTIDPRTLLTEHPLHQRQLYVAAAWSVLCVCSIKPTCCQVYIISAVDVSRFELKSLLGGLAQESGLGNA